MAPVTMGPGEGPSAFETIGLLLAAGWIALMSWLVGRKDKDNDG